MAMNGLRKTMRADTITLTTGVKYDGDKPRMSLVPPKAILEVAKVLTYGAKKYSAENWRKVPEAHQRYLDAALRHINQYHQGQIIDNETGINHLAHAICSLLFIVELDSLKATPEPDQRQSIDILA
jgi:hypothetical protein